MRYWGGVSSAILTVIVYSGTSLLWTFLGYLKHLVNGDFVFLRPMKVFPIRDVPFNPLYM
jgi:hypothetical protein